MKDVRFSIRDSLVAVACIAASIWIYNSMSKFAANYDLLGPGRRQPRTLWPSDAPIVESIALVALMALLVFLPINALIRNWQVSIFRIGIWYWATWIAGLVIYLIWYNARSFPIFY